MDDPTPLSLDKSQVETPVDNSRTAKGVLLERTPVRPRIDLNAVKASPMPAAPLGDA